MAEDVVSVRCEVESRSGKSQVRCEVESRSGKSQVRCEVESRSGKSQVFYVKVSVDVMSRDS